jgi:AmiR/NasT family two-component response regulator
MIADDEPMVANLMAAHLEAIGAKVVGVAIDGSMAVALARELAPDLILMDYRMPKMDGMTATRLIQKQCPTPVVMLTASTDEATVKQAAAAGVGAYLIKIPGSHELERAILIARARFEDLLEMLRLNRELRSALSHLKRLQGMLPICMYCHKIRTDAESWQQLEAYIMEHSEATFSHSICPECCHKYHPDVETACSHACAQ